MSDEFQGLPPGPLVRHLQGMQEIVVRLATAAQVLSGAGDDLLRAHWHHCKAIATYTALDPYNEPTTRPPNTLRVELDDESVRCLITLARAASRDAEADELRRALHARMVRREAATDFPTEQGDFPT